MLVNKSRMHELRVLLVSFGIALAGCHKGMETPMDTRVQEYTPSAAGMVAAIDPETKSLIEPTQGQMNELAERSLHAGRKSVEPAAIPLAGGGVVFRVDPSLFPSAKVSRDAQNNLSIKCDESQ
jgi:hypothetical protein